MTPEQRAATINLARRSVSGERFGIPEDDAAVWIQHMTEIIAAEHPADDDEPVTLEWMESVVPEDGRVTIGMRGDVGHVYIDDGYVDDGVEIKTRRQLRALLEGLGDAQA